MPVDPHDADPSTIPGEPTIQLIVNSSESINRHSDSDLPVSAEPHPAVDQDQVTANGETQSMPRSLEPDTEPSPSFADGYGPLPVAAGYRFGLDLAEVSGGGQRLGQRLLRCGSHTLTDVELVAVLLSGDRTAGGALLVAELLLQAVGGIPGLTRTHPEALVVWVKRPRFDARAGQRSLCGAPPLVRSCGMCSFDSPPCSGCLDGSSRMRWGADLGRGVGSPSRGRRRGCPRGRRGCLPWGWGSWCLVGRRLG